MCSELIKEIQKSSLELAHRYPSAFFSKEFKDFNQELEKFVSLVMEGSEKVKLEEERIKVSESFRYNPIFICGYLKSGTSLLNGLLDFHPKIVSLLPDSHILPSFNELNESIKKDYFLSLSQRYVKRLYSPSGKLPINLYGSGFEGLDIVKYSEFVAYLKYFIEKSQSMAQLLSSLPCTIFATNGQFDRGDRPKFWLEKTPRNERYLDLAKKIFPESRFIYIVRNPYDNLASIRRWFLASGRKKISNPYMYFHGLKKSLKTGIKMRNRSDSYFVKYENIIFNPKKEMEKVSEFLNLEMNKCLDIPTIMGFPSLPNRSDLGDKNRKNAGIILKTTVGQYKKSLHPREIRDITVEFSKIMKSLGYKEEKISNIFHLLVYLFLKIKIFFAWGSLIIKNKLKIEDSLGFFEQEQ